MLIAGRATFSRSLLLVDTGNGSRLLVDGESLIARSFTAETEVGGLVATDAVGVKGVLVFRLTLPRLDVAADAYALLRWDVNVASTGTPFGRLNLEVQREGAAILGLVKAASPARNLSAAAGTRYDEVLHVRIPPTTWEAGERLDAVIELEVTTASGSPGSTGRYALRHDPTSALRASVLEVNV